MSELANEEGQDRLDWSVFAQEFRKRNGHDPSEYEQSDSTAFLWFTIGAHSEHLNRLTPSPVSHE